MIQLINFMLRYTFLPPSLWFIFHFWHNISTPRKCRQHRLFWNLNSEFSLGKFILPLISDHDGQKDWSNEDDVVDRKQDSGEDHGVQFVIEGYRPVELYEKKGRKGITLILSIYQYTHIHWLLSRFSYKWNSFLVERWIGNWLTEITWFIYIFSYKRKDFSQ